MKLSTKLVSAMMMLSVGVAAHAAPAKKKKAAPAAEAPASGPSEAAPAAEAESASTSVAAEKEHRAPYGMAGCGLGSLIIKNHSKGPQIGAAFLNVTGVQTSGISSGSSNCKMNKEDFARVEQEVFMEVNLSSLAKDAAQGQGEHLSAFAEILGCSQDLGVFNTVSRSNYERIFQGQDSKAVLSNFKNVIKSNDTLAKSCVRA